MSLKVEILSFKDKIKDYSMLLTSPWARLSDQPGQNPREVRIYLNSKEVFQTFQGTGAAFSEIGGKALMGLDLEDRENLLKELFSSNEGSGFSNCRLPIGSSDFAFSAYSLNDNKGDYEMEKFSLERDREYLIPFIKEAYKYSENLKIHASPWSAPAWLKDNNDFVNGGSLIDDDKTYKAYAKYLSTFIKEYEKEGIDINKLLIQNEPDSAANFPSCVMEPKQMAKFAISYLRPEFDKEKIKTQIWAGTFRTITKFQAHDFMKIEGCIDAIDGVGFQYALTEHINDFTRTYRDVSIMHTETPCYRGENSWEQAILLFNYFIDYMNVGCEVFSYWNMILDEKAESTWGWKQNSLVTILDNNEIVYNPDFYIMKLISKNVKSNAKRIQCLCLLKHSIAFKNEDGSIVLFVSNLNNKAIKTVISVGDNDYEVMLEESSISVFTIS